MSLEESATAGAPKPKSKMAEVLEGLSDLERAELSQLLQGAKPKVPKPEGASGDQVNRDPIGRDAVNADGGRLDDRKIPSLPKFSGSAAKNEPSFRVWEFEVQNLQSMFGEREVIRAIHHSVMGMAADALMRLGTDATVRQILDKFKLIFGTVVTNEHLLSSFYTAEQKTTECGRMGLSSRRHFVSSTA